MNEIIKLAISVIGVFTLIGSITFYLSLTSNVARMMQGDSNATQDIAEDLADEIAGTLMSNAILAVLIAIAGALGLTGLVTILKKL